MVKLYYKQKQTNKQTNKQNKQQQQQKRLFAQINQWSNSDNLCLQRV